jgi:hypothetical protein
MKTRLISLVMAIALILSQATVFASTDNFVVEITGSGVVNALKLSVEELKAMPAEAQIEEEYIYNSKSGEKIALVKGVSLEYLLKEKAGVTLESGQVLFEAADGYAIDPQTLEDVFNDEFKYVLAYEVDGQLVDDEETIPEEVKIYRKVKETGEFGTVFKMINKITVTGSTPPVEEPEVPVQEPSTGEEKPSVSFTDITDEYKFAETAIYALANKGIIDGMGNGIYSPQNSFTREQFCKIIVEALGYETKDYQAKFSDITTERWSASYIQIAVDNGLFVGNPDGTFLPENVITRQEMAVVVARAAVVAQKVEQEKLNKFVMEKSAYIDKETVPTWAGNSVAWLEAQKVFEGIAGTSFEPAKDVNRAEAALVVYNTLFK